MYSKKLEEVINLPSWLGFANANIALVGLSTILSDDCSNRFRGRGRVVRHWKRSNLIDLGTKDCGSRDSLSSPNVDRLGKGGSQTAEGGSSEEKVAHLEGLVWSEVTGWSCIDEVPVKLVKSCCG
jgi:hypothetical protein